MTQIAPQPMPKQLSEPPHYHGRTVRQLFLAGGIVMVATLPVFAEQIFLPTFISALAVVVIAFLAGLESPEKRWVLILNTVIAGLACLIFEYQAVTAYVTTPVDMTPNRWFFVANQALAVIFFLALYYSSKTLRAPDRMSKS